MNEDNDNLLNELVKVSKNLTSVEMPSKIYHYTSIEALCNGMLVNEGGNCRVCLRALNSMYLNDPEEIKIGFSSVKSVLGKLVELDTFNKYADFCSAYFVTSFTSENDNLPMWNTYARNATGITLGFKSELIKDIENGTMLSCIYDNEEIKTIIEKIDDSDAVYSKEENNNDNAAIIGVVFLICLIIISLKTEKGREELTFLLKGIEPLIRYTFSLKHSSYSYEKEVRLFYSITNNAEIKYLYKNNYIVPYIERYFAKESLEEIIVGPNNDMERTISSIKTYLNNIGFGHVKVIPSSIPYRG